MVGAGPIGQVVAASAALFWRRSPNQADSSPNPSRTVLDKSRKKGRNALLGRLELCL